MAGLRSSRQRDAILNNLRLRYDHPTAEEIYLSIKKEIPSISLATVYRNLKLLEGEGIILRISTQDSDRYDGHIHNHYHLKCHGCDRVIDIEMKNTVDLNTLPINFDGDITGHSLMFFGLCSQCKK